MFTLIVFQITIRLHLHKFNHISEIPPLRYVQFVSPNYTPDIYLLYWLALSIVLAIDMERYLHDWKHKYWRSMTLHRNVFDDPIFINLRELSDLPNKEGIRRAGPIIATKVTSSIINQLGI